MKKSCHSDTVKRIVECLVKNTYTVEKFDNMLFTAKCKHQKNI